MADPTLQAILRRYENRAVFFKALLTQLCENCVAVLAVTTPGTTLPTEWTFRVNSSKGGATARIWSQRLDTNPEFEDIMVFLNFGTRAHWVAPVNKLALSWVENGVRYFSKGHQVSGLRPAMFLAKTDRYIQQFESTIGAKWAAYMNTGALP